ncbi:MAG: DUF2777 domain-containing protein [Bacillaceae bacterium]|nr:DUF2777 domain-containing protein [Bacillaceae bacterium]
MAWKNKKIKDDAIAVVVGSKIFPYSVKTPNPEKNPYPLFIDELEQPALDSLEAGLSHYKMTHKDCVSCYYTLKAQKTGVNFITYRKKEKFYSFNIIINAQKLPHFPLIDLNLPINMESE